MRGLAAGQGRVHAGGAPPYRPGTTAGQTFLAVAISAFTAARVGEWLGKNWSG
jgi:hypothetical protein